MRAPEGRSCENPGKQSDADLTYGERKRRIHVLQSAHKEHEINVEAPEARISIGGGSLARQLHDIQVALKKRDKATLGRC